MSQNPTVNNALRRILRTAVQIAMGGALTLLASFIVQRFGDHLGPQGVAYVLMGATLLTTAAQNIGEKHGWLPIFLPNAHPGTTPPPAPKA